MLFVRQGDNFNRIPPQSTRIIVFILIDAKLWIAMFYRRLILMLYAHLKNILFDFN